MQINSVDRSRFEWIDISKGICMVFIILSHSSYVPLYLDRFYSSFFLAGFFIISGYLFHNPGNTFSLLTKFKKIIDTLIIPYLTYWIISFSVDSILKGDFYFVKDLVVNIIMGNKLWFMSTLIVSEILLAIILSSSRKVTVGILILIFMSIVFWLFFKNFNLVWYIQVSFISNIFISIGYFLRMNNSHFLNLLYKIKFTFILLFLWIICFYLHNYLGYKISFNGNMFGNIVFFIPYSIIGSFLIYKISLKLSLYSLPRIILSFVGKNSLLFYFFQNQVLKILKKILIPTFPEGESYFLSFLVSIIVIGILFIPIKAINRFFPILTGKVKFLSN